MKLYTTGLALVALCSIAFGSFSTDLGFRITTNLRETSSSRFVPGDTFIMDTTETFYSGLGVDFYISPLKNFNIRTGITEFRYLFTGGTEFLLFPGIGADLSYTFPLRRFLPYLTLGLTYRSFRSHLSYQARGGLGLGFVLAKGIKPYFEIQMWDRTYERRPITWGWEGSGTEFLGVGKIHLGTRVKL